MVEKRHKGDSSDYRGLLNYKERVQSFNMACLNLRKYVRVQLEIDASASRSAREIVGARVETLQKTIDAIRQMGSR